VRHQGAGGRREARRERRSRPAFVALALLASLAAPAAAAAEILVLKNGDRVTGRVSVGKLSYTVRTPYGRLVIPKKDVERRLADDGSEILPEATPTPKPAPTPRPAPVTGIELEVGGSVFWYAWAPARDQRIDPTLRLELRLDDEVVAVFDDAQPDPGAVDAPVANAFSFRPEALRVRTSDGARVPAPEVEPGRVVLRVELPVARAGEARLRLAYQVGEDSGGGPEFRDLIAVESEVELVAGRLTPLRLRQERGRMEFSGLFKKRMKNVDTFRLELEPR